MVSSAPIDEIFLSALEKTPADRDAYLSQVCQDDPELRRRVERLLEAHTRAEGFLEHDPAQLQVTHEHGPSEPAELAGTILAGRYKLVEEIAEGGMGTVWVAEQSQPVRRRVAVKLIKPGMDSRQVLSRFEVERQALAMMDHPNIAKVLDGGVTEQGRPFFVMEYVKGVPITDFCDQARLSVEDRLKLFVEVCQAVQHAHQKGIIHRDLKPSNILVCLYDGRPVPKVIDFGLAKAIHQPLTEHTLYTAHGVMVGTPLYMSPEQAEFNNLDIDTRSDVYSLGVILYELLTGVTPLEKERFQEAAMQEILRLIKEEEPSKPSTKLSGSVSLASIAAQRGLEPAQLSRVVRGDLDWIVMKSLEKERSRRYGTANGLARDIERFLHDDPVEASPPTARYRFSKFARRNRAALLTAALVSLALVTGTVVSTWQAIRATRAERVAEIERSAAEQARVTEAEQRKVAEVERNAANAARAAETEQRRLAEAERAEAEKQRVAAEANFQKARAAVEEYFTLVSESKLLDLPGAQSLRKDLLESAERFYRESAQSRSTDPTILADSAATSLRLGLIYQALNRVDDAMVSLQDGLNQVDRLRQAHGDGGEHLRRLAGFWRGLRWQQESLSMPSDPLGALGTMMRLEKTWTDLADTFPDEAAFRADLAAVRGLLGSLLTQFGRAAEGEAWFRKALAVAEKLVQEYPEEPRYRADILAGSGGMVNTLRKNGKNEEALVLLRQGIAMAERLHAEYPDNPIYRSALASAHLDLGLALDRQLSGDGLNHLHQAAMLAKSLARDFPGIRSYADVLQSAAHSWFVAADRSGDEREIEVAAREFIRIESLLMGQYQDDPIPRVRVAIAQCRLARLLEQDDARADRADDYRRRGIAALEEYIAEEIVGDGPRLNTLAWILVTSLQVDPALAEFAVQTAQRAVKALPDNGYILNTLGVAYYRNGQWTEAVETLLQSRKLGSAFCSDAYYLAMAYEKLGEHEAALRWFRAAQAWTVLYNEYQSFYREPAELLGFPADIPARKQVTPEAEQELMRLILEADPSEARWTHLWLAENAARRGKWEAAAAAMTEAIAQTPVDANTYYKRALLQLKTNDVAGYRATCAEMVERFGSTTDADASLWLAWTCGLAPGALDDLQVPLDHAQALQAQTPAVADYELCLGLLLYRSGRYEEAAERLTAASEGLQNNPEAKLSAVYPQFLLTMTHARLGHLDEARQWFIQARATLAKEPVGGMTWNRRVTTELLRAEAHAILKQSD